MREILKQNKDMLVNFLLAGAVIAIVTGSILGYIGRGSESMVQSTDYSIFADAEQLRTAAAIPKPVIVNCMERRWQKGDTIVVGQAFQATDHEGNGLSVHVLQVKNESGQDLTAGYQEDTDSIRLDEAGCYCFKLRAMDGNRKVTTEEIPLVVDMPD